MYWYIPGGCVGGFWAQGLGIDWDRGLGPEAKGLGYMGRGLGPGALGLGPGACGPGPGAGPGALP